MSWTPGLVALDIDGTLVDDEERMSLRVRDAVRRAVEASVPVVLSSGRSSHSMQRVARMLGLVDGWAVASNGSVTYTYDPVEVVSQITFDPAPAVQTVLEHEPEAMLAVEVVGGGYRVNRHFPTGELTGRIWTESVAQLVSEPVTRVIVRHPERSSEDFVSLARALGMDGVNYSVGYTAWLDLAPHGVSKASALAEIAAELDVDQTAVLAIGDGRNDVEMLTWAGRGVAMGQAPDEVKAAADIVTGDLAHDGAALELERLFGRG